MMQQLKTILSALVLALAVSGSPGVSAHSVEDLESMLGDREKYFQPMDRKAPDFTLRTAEGKAISLADLRGNVVVLHFIYASCPDEIGRASCRERVCQKGWNWVVAVCVKNKKN